MHCKCMCVRGGKGATSALNFLSGLRTQSAWKLDGTHQPAIQQQGWRASTENRCDDLLRQNSSLDRAIFSYSECKPPINLRRAWEGTMQVSLEQQILIATCLWLLSEQMTANVCWTLPMVFLCAHGSKFWFPCRDKFCTGLGRVFTCNRKALVGLYAIDLCALRAGSIMSAVRTFHWRALVGLTHRVGRKVTSDIKNLYGKKRNFW
jgi:hypothetical protein